MEFASSVFITLAFAVAGLGGFFGVIAGSWYIVSQGQPDYLALILWPILLFWQLFPVMATAFTNNPDSSELIRYPLSYNAYFLIRLVYGYLDPASALGSVFVCGVLIGVTIARPLLFPWALMVLVTFALFNLLLMQMIFAWIERWLAQRRTREIFGVIFILVMLSFQLIGPAMQRLGHQAHPELRHSIEIGTKVQAALPPGLASAAIAHASRGQIGSAFISLLFLAIMTAAAGHLLHIRIRAQFQGENLSETAARPTVKEAQTPQVGWDVPGLSQSVAAVFEKEMRYLARSGPMLLTLIMPIFMLIIFRLGPMSSFRHSSLLNRTPDMAFPGAAAYALLVLTNLVYNSFGGDGGGIQFFYASPVRFRQIILGKNLTHTAILIANVVLTWLAVSYLYGAPHLAVTIGTIAALAFAAPLNFAAGNILSIYAPKKRDFSTFGRQNAAQTTVLISFVMQIVIVGLGAGVFAIARLYENLWLAVVLFLILAAICIPVYVIALQRLDGLALQRREILLEELCRA